MSDVVKFFGLNNFSIESDLERVAKEHGIELRAPKSYDPHDGYYPQVPEQIRRDAKFMSDHYELFYCVELSIRDLVRSQLDSAAGADWWEKKSPNP